MPENETRTPRRLVIDLDGLRALVAQACRDPQIAPLVRAGRALAPEVAAALEELDANLPHVLAGVEVEARRVIHVETRGAAEKLVRGIRAFVDEAMVASRARAPRAKRLGPKKERRR